MRLGGGKQKGAQFEREICVQLSLWVSGGKQEDAFWRSSMSGGRSTVAHAKGKRLAAQAGDISCIHPIGAKFSDQFMTECKNYANLNYSGLVTGRGHLIEFWAETKKQADRYGKMPLLIAKQNHIIPIACLCEDGAKELGLSKRVVVAPAFNLCILPWFEFLKYAVRPENDAT